MMAHARTVRSARRVPSRRSMAWWALAAAASVRPVAAADTSLSDQGAATTFPGGSAPYQDRVLDDGPQKDQDTPDGLLPTDTRGWLRGLDASVGMLRTRGAFASNARTASLQAFADVPNQGSISLTANATLQQQSASLTGPPVPSGLIWRLDQRAVPLDGGWMNDRAAGNITTALPPLARAQERISLPTVSLEGLGMHFARDHDVDLNIALGSTDTSSGIPLAATPGAAGAAGTGGGILSAGAQARIDPPAGHDARVDAAWQLMDVHGVPDESGSTPVSSQATWSTLRWTGPLPWAPFAQAGTAGTLPWVQGNWLHSRTGSQDSDGVWIDADWRSDQLHNTAGAYWLEPGLRWGPSLLADDLRGAYWRAQVETRRWQVGWSTELSDSLDGHAPASRYASFEGRYSLDTRNAFGAAATLLDGLAGGHTLHLKWDRDDGWGHVQWHGDLAQVGGSDTRFLGVDRQWSWQDATLSTTFGRQRTADATGTASSWEAVLLSNVQTVGNWSLFASVHGSLGNDHASSLNANIGSEWQIRPGWSLAMRYADSRGQESTVPQLLSPLAAAQQAAAATVANSDSRSLQFVLHYSASAGSSSVPLGGVAGAGAGTVAGTIYQDANGNGRRDAGEAGVAEVRVVLDRRYVAITDAQGRYEFPSVASGPHWLQVEAENVPLPWTPAVTDALRVAVGVRETTTQDFALTREQ